MSYLTKAQQIEAQDEMQELLKSYARDMEVQLINLREKSKAFNLTYHFQVVLDAEIELKSGEIKYEGSNLLVANSDTGLEPMQYAVELFRRRIHDKTVAEDNDAYLFNVMKSLLESDVSMSEAYKLSKDLEVVSKLIKEAADIGYKAVSCMEKARMQ